MPVQRAALTRKTCTVPEHQETLLSLTVQDTGIGTRYPLSDAVSGFFVMTVFIVWTGIPADAIPTLFQPWVQAKLSVAREHGGKMLFVLIDVLHNSLWCCRHWARSLFGEADC
jgi:hypothetical protein